MSEVRDFLEALHGASVGKTIPGGQLHMLLWQLEGKRSNWFTDVGAAADFAEANPVNIYVGAAPAPADYGSAARCKASQTAGLVALYADLDIAGPSHKAKAEQLPPDEAAARAIMPEDLPPSILIHSGHGLQAWWILDEPWIFANADDRAAAQTLSKDFGGYLQRRAAARGWKVDSVHDLARVLRIPGTINRKPGLPDVPTRLLSMDGARYPVPQLRAFLAPEAGAGRPRGGYVSAALKATPGTLAQPAYNGAGGSGEAAPAEGGGQFARPPQTPIYELLLMAARRAETDGRNAAGFWFACQCRDAGYSEVDTARQGRSYRILAEQYGDHPYTEGEYAASVRSAYSQPAREPLPASAEPEAEEQEAGESAAGGAEANEAAAGVGGGDGDAESNAVGNPDGEPEEPGAAAGATEQEKRAARALLKKWLKLDIVRVVQFGEDGGPFSIYLADGRTANIGTAETLRSKTRFSTAVFSKLRVELKMPSGDRWRDCLNAMLKLLEVQAGFSEAEMVAEWIESFLDSNYRSVESLKEASGRAALAFDRINGRCGSHWSGGIYETRPGGCVVIKLRLLYRHISQTCNAKLSQADLAAILGRQGFRNTTFCGAMWQGERLRMQRVWVAPAARFNLAPPESMSVRTARETGDDPRYEPFEPGAAAVIQ